MVQVSQKRLGTGVFLCSIVCFLWFRFLSIQRFAPSEYRFRGMFVDKLACWLANWLPCWLASAGLLGWLAWLACWLVVSVLAGWPAGLLLGWMAWLAWLAS